MRNDGLDLIRATGAFLVFATHLYHNFGQTWLGPIADSGHLGIYLFFPLSGYLLYRPFVEGRGDVRRYAVIRVARILPAYYLVIAAIIATGSVDAANPWPALTFTINLFPQVPLQYIGVAWTLGVEVAFYLILPLFAYAKRGWLLPALGLASYVLATFVARDAWYFMQLPTLFWSFAAGMLAARYQNRLSTLARMWPLGVILLMIGLLGPPAVLRDFHAVTLGGTVLILWAAASLPSLPWARWPANISYGVFLWHPLVIGWLVAGGLDGPSLVLAAVVAVCAIAWLSFVVIERPVLRRASAWIRSWDDERRAGTGDARSAAPRPAMAP